MTSTVRPGQVGLPRLAQKGMSGSAPPRDRSWPRGGPVRAAVAMLSVLAAFWVAGCTSAGTGEALAPPRPPRRPVLALVPPPAQQLRSRRRTGQEAA